MTIETGSSTPNKIPGVSLWAVTILPIVSESGRPYNELGASADQIAAAKQKNVNFTVQPTPFRDSRAGFNVNYGAWRDMLPRWQPLLNNLAMLHYIAFGEEKPDVVSLDMLDVLSDMGGYLPYYCAYKTSNNSRPRPVPDELTDLGKTCAGIKAACTHRKQTTEQGPFTSGQELYQFVDEQDLFKTPKTKERACPASKQAIIQATDMLLCGGNYQDSIMPKLMSDASVLIDFTFVLRDFADESEVITTLGEVMNLKSQGIIIPNMDYDEIIRNYPQTKETYIRKCNALQYRMNELLGRDPDTAPIMTSERLLALYG